MYFLRPSLYSKWKLTPQKHPLFNSIALQCPSWSFRKGTFKCLLHARVCTACLMLSPLTLKIQVSRPQQSSRPTFHSLIQQIVLSAYKVSGSNAVVNKTVLPQEHSAFLKNATNLKKWPLHFYTTLIRKSSNGFHHASNKSKFLSMAHKDSPLVALPTSPVLSPAILLLPTRPQSL